MAILLNLVKSLLYRENFHAIHIAMQFRQAAAKNQNPSLYFTWRDSRIRHTPLMNSSVTESPFAQLLRPLNVKMHADDHETDYNY